MLKIEYLDEEIPVYDITVAENNNFFGNGILLHNCSEIMLCSNKERTAVCCLSSLNIMYYNEWKNDEKFIPDVLEMLDNVLSDFIKNAPKQIGRAIYSAMRERSVGVGALGFHSYLQKENIAFESLEAVNINNKIFYHIRKQLDETNKKLGTERGEAPDIQSIIEFEGDNGEVLKINSSDFVKILRCGEILNVRAFSIEEGDEILM